VQANDYTSHPSWYGPLSPSLYNKFRLTGDETVTLTVQAVAPALPPINDAIDFTRITEEFRSTYLTQPAGMAEMRPGYRKDTVIGFSLQAKFGAQSIAESYTYMIYRSKIESEESLITHSITTTPVAIETDELYNNYRDKVLPHEELTPGAFDSGPIGITLPVITDVNNNYAFTVPKLFVLFGSESDYNIIDNPNDATYYYYLNGSYTWDEVTVGSVITRPGAYTEGTPGQESLGRGYSYYATYTAKLDLTPPASSQDGYIYPRDYSADGQDHAALGTVLFSKRIKAEMQKPIVKTYPSSSDTGLETWKYNMRDLDAAYIQDSLIAPATVSANYALDPANPVAQPVNVPVPVYNPITIASTPGAILENKALFTVLYKYDKWRDTLVGHAVPGPDKYEYLMQEQHEDPVTLSPGAYEVYVNETRSRLYVVFRTMTDALHTRLATTKITVQNPGNLPNDGDSPKTKDYYVKIDKIAPFDDAYPTEADRGENFYAAYIDLQTLTADLKQQKERPLLTVSDVGLYYDDGHRGFDIFDNETYPATPTKFFTMQEMIIPTDVSDPPFGLYYNRIGVSATNSQMNAASLFFGNKSFRFVEPTTDASPATLAYRALLDTIASPRSVAMSYKLSESGAMEEIRGLNLVPKLLKLVNSEAGPKPGTDPTDIDKFILPPLVPEVYDYAATPGLTDAVVTFRVQGLSVLNGFDDDTATIKLEFSKRVSIGGGSDTTLIDTKMLTVSKAAVVASGNDSQTFTVTFSNLDMNTLYVFQLMGDVTTTDQKFLDHGPEPTTGRFYQFRTSDSVGISDEVTFKYRADTYTNKFIDATYTLTGAPRGYYIQYQFKDTDGGAVKTVNDQKSVYNVTGGQNKTAISIAADDPFFKFGHTYEVVLVAYTTSTNQEIGRSPALPNYVHQNPTNPTFVVTNTPKNIPDGKPESQSGTWQNYPTEVSINPIDEFCSIAGTPDGQYLVRIVNSVGEDVTSMVTKNISPEVNLSERVFTFNKTANKVQKFTIAGSDLPYVAEPYLLNIYALVDLPYAGATAENLIAAHKYDDNTALLENSLFMQVRSIQFNVHNENEVEVGDVQVSSLASGTRLIFLNEINLASATEIQYSIINLGTDTMPLASQWIPFAMSSSTGGSPYKYFDLPTSISDAGTYQIQLRFHIGGGLEVTKSITYTKI
jgi:hypothetical protein